MRTGIRIAKLMATPAGRGVRIGAGAALISAGLMRGDTRGAAMILLGAVPLTTGLANWCVLAPLMGAPFQGAELRRWRYRF